jgi:hypothetical protein
LIGKIEESSPFILALHKKFNYNMFPVCSCAMQGKEARDDGTTIEEKEAVMTGQKNKKSNSGTGAKRPVITFDYSLYDHYLDDTDLSDAQKREFLETMWNLIVELMSLGFDVHPVQQARDACGKLPECLSNPPISKPGAVQSDNQFLTENFSDAAKGSARKATERIEE